MLPSILKLGFLFSSCRTHWNTSNLPSKRNPTPEPIHPPSLSLSLSEKISKENKASSFKLNKKNEFQQAMLGILPAFHRDLCMRKTSSFAFPPLLLLTFFFLFLINTFLNIKHAVKRLARVTPSPSHHRIQEISYFYFFLKWTHPFTLQYSQAPPTKSLNYSQTLSSLSPILQI